MQPNSRDMTFLPSNSLQFLRQLQIYSVLKCVGNTLTKSHKKSPSLRTRNQAVSSIPYGRNSKRPYDVNPSSHPNDNIPEPIDTSVLSLVATFSVLSSPNFDYNNG